MAAIRVSVPGVGTRHIDLGPSRAVHHDYERERSDALRWLDADHLWRRSPVVAYLARLR